MASPLYRSYHQRTRIVRMAHLARHQGRPCRRCGQPMYTWQPLDLGHPTDGYVGYDLEHRDCNRRAGGINGNKSPKRAGKPDNRRQGKGRRW